MQAQEVPEAHRVELVTFTYDPRFQWSPRHIAQAVDAYRKQARRDGVDFRYEWVAELQLSRMRRRLESAAHCLHYHMLTWTPEGYAYPKPDSRGWWRHGMTNVEVARYPVAYLCKYASKGSKGERFPRGVRISGGGGLSALGKAEARWWLLPRYVREAFPAIGEDIQRKRGGGWCNWDTGEWIPAQWPEHLPQRPSINLAQVTGDA